MNQSLRDYLRQLGLERNPFVDKVAEEEEDLPRYFVKRSYFDSVLSTSVQNTTILYFADRGKGKTATARMVAYLLTKTQDYGAGVVVNFARDAFEQLLDEMKHHPEDAKRKLYREHLLRAAKEAVVGQWERLRQHKNLAHQPPDLQVSQLKDLAERLFQAGVSAIYFLIDGVDELVETGSEPESGAKLILPLLTDLSLLETPHAAFKFFLPLQLLAELRNQKVEIRFDRFEPLIDQLEWSEDELHQLLSNRLEVLSNGQITTGLGNYSEAVDIDLRLCRAAQGSPRNLLRLGNYLLDYHLHEGLPDKISERSLEKAVQRLNTILATEDKYKSASRNILSEVLPDSNLSPTSTLTTHTYPEVPAEPEDQLLHLVGSDVFIGKQRIVPAPGGLELKLLRELYRAKGRTCLKDDLIRAIYSEIAASDEQLNATVKRLRKKLNNSGEYYIETVRGVGFRLCNFD